MSNVWIFQGNPDTFDIMGYLQAGLDRITWSVTRYAKQIKVGDLVYLWQAKGSRQARSGIVASARVISQVWKGVDDQASLPFWVLPEQANNVQSRVWLKVDRVANEREILQREWLLEDPVCRDLLILRQAAGTNYLVNKLQAGRLEALWARYGEDWVQGDGDAMQPIDPTPQSLSPWDLAIDRIRVHRQSRTYMPVAVLAAIQLIEEGGARVDDIPFDYLEARFDELQITFGEGAVGKAWEPFLHLASTAAVWTLRMGSDPVPYSRDTRPRSRAQLLTLADRACLSPELWEGLSDHSVPARLKSLIGESTQKPTTDLDVLSGAVKSLKGKLGMEPPPGNAIPKQVSTGRTAFERDPKVVRWVLDRAKGTCEHCGKPAPFLDKWKEPFLEVHHVIPLAEGGPDTVENARALCPNCHREAHHGIEKESLLVKLATIEILA